MAELEELHRQRCALDAREAELLGGLARRWAARPGSTRRPVGWWARTTGLRRSTSRVRVATAVQLELLPRVAQALAGAEVTFDHVRLIAQVAGRSAERLAAVRAAEAELVAQAGAQSADGFARWLADWDRRTRPDDGDDQHRRQRRLRKVARTRDRDGLPVTEAHLDVEAHATVWDELDRLVRADRAPVEPGDAAGGVERTLTQRYADALVAMARRSAGADPDAAARSRPRVVVHLDYRTLLEGLHTGGVCELADGTPLPPATARRLACDADLVPVVLGGASVPLEVGRARRLATTGQRDALRARHRTCAWPGCPVPFTNCEIHHLVPWDHGGTTDLANLVPLCLDHHSWIHECRTPVSVDPTTGSLQVHDRATAHPIWDTPTTHRWWPTTGRWPLPRTRQHPPPGDPATTTPPPSPPTGPRPTTVLTC